MQKFSQVGQEWDGSISDYLIYIEGVLNDIKTKFPTQLTEMQSDQLLQSRFYSRLCSQICNGMRDMFRNLAYDVTALIKAAQDLEDEHALEQGQWQMMAKAASAGDPGDSPSGLEVITKPLSETESQMRAFTKEVSAWISECKAWNTKCKLARANNSQVWGQNWQSCPGAGQNHNNRQGQATQHQPA